MNTIYSKMLSSVQWFLEKTSVSLVRGAASEPHEGRPCQHGGRAFLCCRYWRQWQAVGWAGWLLVCLLPQQRNEVYADFSSKSLTVSAVPEAVSALASIAESDFPCNRLSVPLIAVLPQGEPYPPSGWLCSAFVLWGSSSWWPLGGGAGRLRMLVLWLATSSKGL